MANPKYPAWVSQLSERQLVDTFGSDTLKRGQAYAAQSRVGHIAVGSGTGGSLVQAQVRGSSYYSYATVVRHIAATDTLISTCSCPVRSNCKHGAALVWHMHTVNMRALTPAWQLALDEVTADAQPAGQGQPLAVSVARPSGMVQLRPLVWGRSGRWVKTGITWDQLAYPWQGNYREGAPGGAGRPGPGPRPARQRELLLPARGRTVAG
ncbi:MAG: hypothetical protein IPL41_00990 [Micropruina sp.]|nr:hypothetical protein [Micropruina sp.]